ncbi:MAG: hypothetical protein ABJA67_16735 [Chthonomonadales bacterium]
MRSFELIYNADEDVLEVMFEEHDERFARTITLNEQIFLFTDPGLTSVWGMAFYSFSKLIGVAHTEFVHVAEASPEDADRVLALLTTEPANLFFHVTDPERFLARFITPNLRDLLKQEED